jgi:hypothetical protein
MTFIEEASVSLTDVAKRAGLTVDEVKAEAAALNMFVGEDWKHQEALSAKDAFVLLDGSARRNMEHQNAFQTHVAALEEWQRQRENVRREAFGAEWEVSVKRGYGNSASTDKAHAAARQAVAEYEARNPEPVFAEPESRLQTWIKRVKAGAR